MKRFQPIIDALITAGSIFLCMMSMLLLAYFFPKDRGVEHRKIFHWRRYQ